MVIDRGILQRYLAGGCNRHSGVYCFVDVLSRSLAVVELLLARYHDQVIICSGVIQYLRLLRTPHNFTYRSPFKAADSNLCSG